MFFQFRIRQTFIHTINQSIQSNIHSYNQSNQSNIHSNNSIEHSIMHGIRNERLTSLLKAFSENHSSPANTNTSWKWASVAEKEELRFEVKTIVHEIDSPKSIEFDKKPNGWNLFISQRLSDISRGKRICPQSSISKKKSG